jgi:predicted transcriptional regulator
MTITNKRLIIDPDIRQQLMALAETSGHDPQEMVNCALHQYLMYETKVLAKIRVGVEQAGTGLVASHREVVAGLHKRIANR